MRPESDMSWLTDHRPRADAPSAARTAQVREALIAHGIRRRRVRRQTRGGIVIALVVAAAVVVLATGGAAGGRRTQPGQAAAFGKLTLPGHGPAVQHAPAPSTPLVRLASYVRVMKAPRQPGDATLVVRDTFVEGRHVIDGAVYGGYNLYTDAGVYYYAPDSLSQLQQSVDQHQPSSDGGNETKVLDGIAAAAADTPAQARQALLDTQPRDGRPGTIKQLTHYDRGLPQRVRRRILSDVLRFAKKSHALRIHEDSLVYVVATQALEVGAGNPNVRAGAMEALDTLTGLTETAVRVHGIRALKVYFPNDGLPETIWLDAKTGIPIQEKDGADSVTSYIVERVNAAHLPTQVTTRYQLR
jgi:hypothetical protein